MARRRSPAARRQRRAARKRSLSNDWRVWVVDNLLAGVTRHDVVDTLVRNRVPAAVARAEVDAILASPSLVACERLAERVRKLELVASLRRALAQCGDHAARIERRPHVPAAELYEHYYAAQKPVILTEVVTSWPAHGRWSPAYFKDTLGHVPVEISSGRDADPDCDRNFNAHREPTTMAAYVDRVLAAGVSNDIYMIAHNHNMQRDELGVLIDDVVIDEELMDPDEVPRASTLWFGPAGTVTPLHHDCTSILFCQIYGRKRVTLISPWETSLLDDARGYFSRLDLEDPGAVQALEDRGVVMLDEELAAGEALFIPAGFWHHIRALDVSITFSLMAFRRPNDVGWYRPGLPPE